MINGNKVNNPHVSIFDKERTEFIESSLQNYTEIIIADKKLLNEPYRIDSYQMEMMTLLELKAIRWELSRLGKL